MSGNVMRLYRALLHLYPAGYRAEYEGELCAVFAERQHEVSGPLAPARRLLAAVADVVPNALAVHWDVLGQDLRHTARALRRAPGFAVTAVLVVARTMGALLAGVRPEDPVTVGMAAALCLTTALLGCLRPALRAARVDPATALRAD